MTKYTENNHYEPELEVVNCDEIELEMASFDEINVKDQQIITEGGDKNYLHKQNIPSDEWVINHNLGKYPAVSIMDSAKNEVVGEIIYHNENSLTAKFKGEFSGKATLN